MAHLAITEMDLTHFAPLILQRLCNALLPKREDFIWPFFETMAAITCFTIQRAPDADPKPPLSTCSR